MKTLYNQHACGQQQNLRLTFMLLPVAMLATARTLEAYKKPVSCLHQQFILQPPVDTTHSDSTRWLAALQDDFIFIRYLFSIVSICIFIIIIVLLDSLKLY